MAFYTEKTDGNHYRLEKTNVHHIQCNICNRQISNEKAYIVGNSYDDELNIVCQRCVK